VRQRAARILIWGISGAAKSRYCRWLEKRGYVYVDNDTVWGKAADGTATALEQHWMAFRGEQLGAREFVDAIGAQPVVVEFGARPNEAAFAQLSRLVDLGFSAWWLDGDRNAALKSWLDRELPAAEEFWQVQTAWVDFNWHRIAEAFRSRIVRTIGPERAYLSEPEIDRLMFGELNDQSG
jgi:hypothetical protein